MFVVLKMNGCFWWNHHLFSIYLPQRSVSVARQYQLSAPMKTSPRCWPRSSSSSWMWESAQGSKYTPQPINLNVKAQYSSFRIISRRFSTFLLECCICCLEYSCQEPGSLFRHTDFQLLERILQIKQQAPSVHTTQLAVEQICFPFLVGVSRASSF